MKFVVSIIAFLMAPACLYSQTVRSLTLTLTNKDANAAQTTRELLKEIDTSCTINDFEFTGKVNGKTIIEHGSGNPGGSTLVFLKNAKSGEKMFLDLLVTCTEQKKKFKYTIIKKN